MNTPGNGDDKFMQRCIDLAARAEGMTRPNPLVGAVIVHKGIIIGEGYHIRAGGPHAEVLAINSVSDKSLLKESSLYVSLEPCSHHGKTPPCTDLIISSGIPKVIVGTTDTSERVSGRGIQKLKSEGREVIAGVLEKECRWLNRRFFTFNELKRPYITLKWAQSADGFIDTIRPRGNGTGPYWISGNPERVLVHKWRAEEEAILAGANTVRTDNPRLNVRLWGGADPMRIILSGSGDLKDYLTSDETNGTVIVFSYSDNEERRESGWIKLNDKIPASKAIASYLFDHGIQSLLVEGGAEVLNHFIECGMWDEARIFKGFSRFKKGLMAPDLKGRIVSVSEFDKSRLEIIVNDLREPGQN